jgi:predicted alpha/beta hydrolase family esterase
MPKQILFIQGGGDGTHDAWDNRLVASLETELGPDYAVRYPPMPNEGDPNYPAWKAELFKQFDALDEGAILVGHSLGGSFLIHALAENRPKRKWGAVALLAPPFFGAGGWPDDAMDPATLGRELRADVPVLLYHGTADGEVPPAHMALYAKAIPHATPRTLADSDHQLNNDLSKVAKDIRDLLSR